MVTNLQHLNFWQSLPLKMNPVAFSLGSFDVYWYGLMYFVAIITVWLLLYWRIKKETVPLNINQLTDFMLALIIGVIVGARLGYAVFYQPAYYLTHPLQIVLPFDFTGGFHFTGISGMSYHGGLIGVVVAAIWFCRKHKLAFWRVVDFAIPAIPLGYTFGRLGNFINGELYGRVTDSALGMFFPLAGDSLLRHPSQLYEAFFEGLALFVILWSMRNKEGRRWFPVGGMLAFYLFGYGFCRFMVEFFRAPDAHLGFVFVNLSMGQVLCTGMMLFALIVFIWLKLRRDVSL